jgi:polysaccharide biosynthesis protein PslH
MRVAILDEGLPFPPNTGKTIRTYNLVSRLAARHHITYLCHANEHTQDSVRAEDHFRALGIDVIRVDHAVQRQSGLGFYARLLANLISPLPYSVQAHTSVAMLQAAQRLAATDPPDVWHCEWSPYAQCLRSIGATPRIVMAHNVESLIWQRYYENEANPLKRWYIGLQWRKMERFERQVFADAAETITVSEPDAVLARERFEARRVNVVDNGVDVAYFQPRPDVPRDGTILFVGSLFWRPNLDAVRLLINRIFPAVLAEIPSARLQIVGRSAPSWLCDLVQRCPNAELHADVPDVRPFLWQCGVMAVPLRIGGGSRLKILESLACECPVVSTQIGAEGLNLQSGEHFVQVPGIDEMAAALVDALRNPAGALRLARAGREAVESLYNWDLQADRLNAIWSRHASASIREDGAP